MNLRNIFGITLAILFIALLFLFAFIWIIFDFQGSTESLKNTWSIIGSIFGGMSTLAAAYIATYLFNDWRDQHNKQILAIEAKNTFLLFHNERDYIHKVKYRCKNIISDTDKKKYSWLFIATEYENDFLDQHNLNKDKMSAFCFLSKGQLAYNLTKNYGEEVGNLADYLSKMRNKVNSESNFLDEKSSEFFLSKLVKLESKNTKVLLELENYIFIRDRFRIIKKFSEDK